MTRSSVCNLRLLSCCLLLAALLPPWMALGGNEGPPVESHRPQAAIEGIVLSVGRDTLAIQENMTGSTIAFAVAPYAAIRKDGEITTLAAIHPGDAAQVLTDTDGREYKAVSITAETSPPKK